MSILLFSISWIFILDFANIIPKLLKSCRFLQICLHYLCQFGIKSIKFLSWQRIYYIDRLLIGYGLATLIRRYGLHTAWAWLGCCNEEAIFRLTCSYLLRTFPVPSPNLPRSYPVSSPYLESRFWGSCQHNDLYLLHMLRVYSVRWFWKTSSESVKIS